MKFFKKEPLIAFIILSLLLHFTLVGALKLAEQITPDVKDDTIEIVVIETPEPEQDDTEKQQIVDSQFDPNLEMEPEDAKFLSAKNQRVQKETKARKLGEFKNVKPGQKAPQPVPQKPVAPQTTPKLADLIPQFGTTPPPPNFPKPIAGGEGESQTEDYLKDTATDIHTMLNTREFVYYSYYSRIRQRLKEYWEPSIKDRVERMLRQGRSIASSRDRITKLVIVLNESGSLIGVQVIGESGIRDLDDAAVDAFRSAAPFPNPPKGIIEDDGTIKIRWDFILEA